MKRLEKAYELSTEADIYSVISFAGGGLGHAYQLMNRPDEAMPILEVAANSKNFESAITSSIYPLTVQAETYHRRGLTSDALQFADKALRISRKTGERYFGAWALYVLAMINAETDVEQAIQTPNTFLQAIDQAAELEMRPLLAHCRLNLGKFYLRVGRLNAAHSEISHALELYRSMKMTYWQPEAKALLTETAEKLGP